MTLFNGNKITTHLSVFFIENGNYCSFTTDQCIDVFQRVFGGEEVQNNCDETNRFYGGLQLPVSNVLFVNGEMDPWRNVTFHTILPKYPDNAVITIPG